MRKAIGLVVAAAVAGCGGEGTLGLGSTTDEWTQSRTNEVDILWVIDSSSSMQAEQELLSAGFESFASQLDGSGTDFHLGVISTDFEYSDAERGRLIGDPLFLTSDDADYVQRFGERARVGLEGSGKEKGFESALFALSTQMTNFGAYNDGFLRSTAELLIVFVSDEDDCSDEGALQGQEEENLQCYYQPEALVPVSTYVQRFRALKDKPERVHIGTIVGPQDQEANAICDENTVPGERYLEFSRLMGGLSGSICESDWSLVLDDLGLTAVGQITTFILTRRAVESSLEVTVKEQGGRTQTIANDPENGYTYDDEAQSITFHGSAVPGWQAEISASYDIKLGL